MARPQYTTQQTFGPYPAHYNPGSLVVKANGGSVTVEADVGNDEWASFLTLSEDSSKEVFVAHGRFRVTPTGGAAFSWVVQ